MYIINTVFKPTKTGGKYKCTVHGISNIKVNPYNVTNQVADRFGLVYKDGYIIIPFGSGTGAMVLKQLLEEGTGIDPMNHSLKVFVFDISL